MSVVGESLSNNEWTKGRGNKQGDGMRGQGDERSNKQTNKGTSERTG